MSDALFGGVDKLGTRLVNNYLVCCLFCLTGWLYAKLTVCKHPSCEYGVDPSRLKTSDVLHCNFVMNSSAAQERKALLSAQGRLARWHEYMQ